jgi:hypothetical protein
MIGRDRVYEDYCDRIRAAGKFAMFHSDGVIAMLLGTGQSHRKHPDCVSFLAQTECVRR